MTEEDPAIKAFLSEETADGTKQIIRFCALANAGGVLATVTIIGASAKNGSINAILAVPLGFFCAGVVVAMISVPILIFTIRRLSVGSENWVWPLKKLAPWLGKAWSLALIFMIGFFILGCIAGVTIVALALCPALWMKSCVGSLRRTLPARTS